MATTSRKKTQKTKTLYTYVRPVNRQWVQRNYKKQGFTSYSDFMDHLITYAREHDINFKKDKAA